MKHKRYYFIGIGGIGMSALAHHLHQGNHEVFGYDKTPSKITAALEAMGIKIIYDAEVEALPPSCLATDTQIIYTAAIPKQHPQFQFFHENNFNMKKRAALLGELTQPHTTLAVAGTHGKTTTSAILSHLLQAADCAFTAFIGGVMMETNSNYLNKGNEYWVVEADEFDRSFLHLFPKHACVTSLDPDHLDVYQNEATLSATYAAFASQVSGTVITPKGLGMGTLHYALNDSAHFSAHDIQTTPTGYVFTLHTPEGTFPNTQFPMIGQHNICNALAAIALASQIGLPMPTLVSGLATFKGIERRMNLYPFGDKVLVDDYAHHPTEIQAVYNSLRNHFPTAKLGVVFQPHLFSRTRDFWNGFTSILEQFDSVALMAIYPAREAPLPGITSEALLEGIHHPQKSYVTEEGLYDYIQQSENEVIAILGAGDIGLAFQKIIAR